MTKAKNPGFVATLFSNVAGHLGALYNRVEISYKATRDPSDRADTAEYLEDIAREKIAMLQLAPFAPIIDDGLRIMQDGKSFAIVVYEVTGNETENTKRESSIHLFMLE